MFNLCQDYPVVSLTTYESIDCNLLVAFAKQDRTADHTILTLLGFIGHPQGKRATGVYLFTYEVHNHQTLCTMVKPKNYIFLSLLK